MLVNAPSTHVPLPLMAEDSGSPFVGGDAYSPPLLVGADSDSPSPRVGEGWGGGVFFSLPPGGGGLGWGVFFSLPPGGGGLGWGVLACPSLQPSPTRGVGESNCSQHALAPARSPRWRHSCPLRN